MLSLAGVEPPVESSGREDRSPSRGSGTASSGDRGAEPAFSLEEEEGCRASSSRTLSLEGAESPEGGEVSSEREARSSGEAFRSPG